MKKIYLLMVTMASISFALNAQVQMHEVSVAGTSPSSSFGGNCNIPNMSGPISSGFLGWVAGDASLYTWFDIAGTPGCGLTYPFTLEQVDINIADPSAFGLPAGSGTGTLTFQVNVYDAMTPGDPCTEPGALIASSGNQVSVYADEGLHLETVTFNQVLNNAFFVSWELVSWTGPGPENPSPLWDDQFRPLCRQWITNDGGTTLDDFTDFFLEGDTGWVDITIDGTGSVQTSNCSISNMSGNLAAGFLGWAPGDGSIWTWFDVAGTPGCGLTYPYTLQQVDINIADPSGFGLPAGSGTGTLTYQVNVYDAITPGDPCTEPGTMIASSGNQVSAYADEGVRIETVPFNQVLNTGFFIEWQFISWTGPGPEVPTPLWDDVFRPLCRQWITNDGGVTIQDHTDFFLEGDTGWVDITIDGTATPGGGGPANDDCNGAIALTPNSTCVPTMGDVTGATESIPAILCNGFTGDADSDVWYSFVATATSHDIEMTGSADFDGVIELLEGTCLGLVSLDCADATLEGETEVINATGLTIGNTYYVRVYDYYSGTPTTPTFDICVIGAAGGPPNDDCTGSITQALNAGGSVVFNGDNTGATDDGQGLGFNQVWESFTTTECLDVVLEYCGSATVFGNVFIRLYDGCPFSTFEQNVSWNDTDCLDGNITVYWENLPAGTWYYPVLADVGNEGPYMITVSGTACASSGPVNDDCPGAIVLTPSPTCVPTTADVTGATESMPAILCNGFTGVADSDLWFSFVATQTSHDIEVTGSADFDAVVELLEGTCAAPNSLDCADATLEGELEVIMATGLTIGNTYYVRVYDYYVGTPTTPTFDICIIGTTAVPSNDDCANAQSINVYGQLDCPGMSTTGTTAGATHTGADPDCDATNTAFQDVWYWFNSGSNTEVNIELNNITATDLFPEVLDGCTGTSIFCTVSAGPPYQVMVNPNTNYWIRMFTNQDFGVGGSFDLCVWAPVSTDIEEASTGSFEIFPNPATSFVTLRNLGPSVEADVELMDMNGKIVLTTQKAFGTNGDHVIDLNELAPGVYMLSLTNDEDLEVRQRLFIK